jgi:hypothetical protein
MTYLKRALYVPRIPGMNTWEPLLELLSFSNKHPLLSFGQSIPSTKLLQ